MRGFYFVIMASICIFAQQKYNQIRSFFFLCMFMNKRTIAYILPVLCIVPMLTGCTQSKNDCMNGTHITMETSEGSIELELFKDKSPKTVENFTKLACEGFYDNTKFHRVIDGFMIQGGDPLSKEQDKTRWGTGGPGYKFADEFNDEKLVAGSLAMANSGANTNGSQFFIVTAESTPWLDKRHTNFGKVTKGMDIVEKIEKSPRDQRDVPLADVVLKKVTVK